MIIRYTTISSMSAPIIAATCILFAFVVCDRFKTVEGLLILSEIKLGDNRSVTLIIDTESEFYFSCSSIEDKLAPTFAHDWRRTRIKRSVPVGSGGRYSFAHDWRRLLMLSQIKHGHNRSVKLIMNTESRWALKADFHWPGIEDKLASVPVGSGGGYSLAHDWRRTHINMSVQVGSGRGYSLAHDWRRTRTSRSGCGRAGNWSNTDTVSLMRRSVCTCDP